MAAKRPIRVTLRIGKDQWFRTIPLTSFPPGRLSNTFTFQTIQSGDRPGAGSITLPTGALGGHITGIIITAITIIITTITTDISAAGTPIGTRYGKPIITAAVIGRVP